jgi:hypothetical protein
MIFDIAADLLITNADLNDLKKRLKGIACTSKSIDDNTGRIFSFSVGGHQTSFTISELGFVTAGGAFGGAATNTAGSYLFYQGGGLLGGLGGGLIPGAGETGTTEIAGYFAGARIGTAIWNFPAVRGPLDALGAGAGSAVGDSAYKAAAAAVDRFCRR